MQKQTEKTYTVKPQDFIPFVGSFIYLERNWKDENGELKKPQPYKEYRNISDGLTVLNMATGFASLYAIFQGLEALIK